MKIRKAVITAAAPDQSTIPLQRLVDRDGQDKTALQSIVEETLSAGIEEICLVIAPGSEDSFRKAAGPHIGCLQFVVQSQPQGYAHAVAQGRDFADGEPILHLVGDHLYLSQTHQTCARQLIDVASDLGSSVSAVQATRESRLPYFGVVAGTHVPRHSDLYEVSRVVEKPTPTQAEQELVTAGLRSGHYLGFFGMHVLTADAMDAVDAVVAEQNAESSAKKATLSDALATLPTRSRYLAYRVQGNRYNIGVKYGMLVAQLAFGLSGTDRDQILTEMVELLAQHPGRIADMAGKSDTSDGQAAGAPDGSGN
ncbi:sugar phosphate nucleotidyltransferase [Crateriforma conspicua]|uniref:sugar phosphate nucleotidyltransferase n=1 Tax=Crateriforma conspicua TaxID=2527996 RepID=UPI00118C6F86|nr:sugar phosphate nucleotidyltransferase [Crateriforma conspicua]QDV61596.1 UTP--glucose-1-phosphate uridylyltransferase [Crateriforma conspicua]